MVVTVLVVLPVGVTVIAQEVQMAVDGPADDKASAGWTIDSEKAFLQGCTLFGTADSESTRICACLLVDMKRAGRSPADAAEMSDDVLHQRTPPSWVRPIFEGCQ
jgi:hypothetical protein